MSEENKLMVRLWSFKTRFMYHPANHEVQLNIFVLDLEDLSLGNKPISRISQAITKRP